MQKISLRFFAHELWREARKVAKPRNFTDDAVPGPRHDLYNRSIVRLVTMTIQRAHAIGIEPGLTQTHLEATQAVMQALSVIGDKHHVSDQLSIEDTISGDWALILSETLRTVTLNELLPSRPSSWNTPNLQNVPRQIVKPVNFAMQSSAADLSNVPKKLSVDDVTKAMSGFTGLCLGCAYPTVARHHSDCAKRQPVPPKAPE